MAAYECKADNRGRILLPKQIRHLFEKGAIIETDEEYPEAPMFLKPLEDPDCAKVEIDLCDEDKRGFRDFLSKAFELGVAVRKAEDHGEGGGWPVAELSGGSEAVEKLLGYAGYGKEEIYYLMKGE